MTESVPASVPGATTTILDEEDMMSVGSFVPGMYQEDDDSVYRGDGGGHGGPHSGRYSGLNHGGVVKSFRYHDGNGSHGGGGHFVSNDQGHMRTFQWVKGRSVPIEFYMTKYTQGTLIRNAISGIREHKMYVGKKEEYSLFKVKLSLPDMGNDSADSYGTLFYNSPEEYERHFYTTVPQSLKEQWMERLLRTTPKRDVTKSLPPTTDETSTSFLPGGGGGWFRDHRIQGNEM